MKSTFLRNYRKYWYSVVQSSPLESEGFLEYILQKRGEQFMETYQSKKNDIAFSECPICDRQFPSNDSTYLDMQSHLNHKHCADIDDYFEFDED